MKKLNTKSFLIAAVALLLGGGAYLNYRMATAPVDGMSDLTLANLEAMARFVDPEMDMDPDNPEGCISIASCKSGAVIKCSGQRSCDSSVSSDGYITVICDGVAGSGCY